jgi:uncharacterized protein YwbE
MTKNESQRLAALVALFVQGGYRLPSAVRSSEGSFRFTDYGSNSEELYAQEQETGRIIRGVVTQPNFSLDYGSDSRAVEVQISGNQVYRVQDKINSVEYFPHVSGSQVTIDSLTFYKG